MSRPKREMITTESIFAVAWALARRGVLTTAEAAEIGDYVYHSADEMLNKAARVIPITKLDLGVWMVNDEITELAERVRPALDRAREELTSTPPSTQFVRPMARRDFAILVQTLEMLLRERRASAECAPKNPLP